MKHQKVADMERKVKEHRKMKEHHAMKEKRAKMRLKECKEKK